MCVYRGGGGGDGTEASRKIEQMRRDDYFDKTLIQRRRGRTGIYLCTSSLAETERFLTIMIGEITTHNETNGLLLFDRVLPK